jgi:hypothetical protein
MKVSEDFEIRTNEFQTPITAELINSLPDEVAEQLIECVDTIPFIRNLVSADRRRAKDMPHDDEGRVIVDFENPHILEDMDYFRPSALHFQKHGCYTFLTPNANPNSEYMKWAAEEKRRCREGYVRGTDGEWVTGYMYFYINYCPIMLTKIIKGQKKADRVEDFPEMWEGIYLRFHYAHQAREEGHHGIELARRGASKSYSLASMLAHNLIFGENNVATKRVTSILTAYQKEYLADKDGTLSKFEPMINFIAEHTEFPRLRLRDSSNEMFWQMGYKDSYNRKKGSLNSVMGVSSKDDSGKLRGKRGHIYFEEMGQFPNLLDLFNIVRQGMEEGDFTFGFAYLVGTASEKDSNFDAAKKMLNHPTAYNIKPLKNVYDKPKQGSEYFGFFFPAYLNRKGNYNKDGVSDVVGALIEILLNRYNIKYSQTDPATLLTTIAEMPITPAEAILKVRTSYFPTVDILERIRQLDADPKAYDDVYIGELYFKDNKVAFRPTSDIPIRQYDVENTTKGALEIYELPQSIEGNIPEGRYIIGHDPVNNDQANSKSLSSTFVLDLWTDRLVAEYTGRNPLSDDNFEILRRLCLFYNAKCLYESNNKGTFAYFKSMNSTHLLADTPAYLRDKQIIKYSSFGSNSKGVNATKPVNDFADSKIRDWLLKEVTIHQVENGKDTEITVPNLYLIRNRALLDELANYNPVGNFDRIRALGMVMLYRQEKVSLVGKKAETTRTDYMGDDDYFNQNYPQP